MVRLDVPEVGPNISSSASGARKFAGNIPDSWEDEHRQSSQALVEESQMSPSTDELTLLDYIVDGRILNGTVFFRNMQL